MRCGPLCAVVPGSSLFTGDRRHNGEDGVKNPHVRLSAIAAELRVGALDSEAREQLAESLERIASGEDAATALGVKRAPGQRSWGTRIALDQRDRLLRGAAECFLGGMSVAAQAECLHKTLSRYCASAWQRERVCEQCPGRHRGTIHELLWRVLKLHDRVLSVRSLRLILATS